MESTRSARTRGDFLQDRSDEKEVANYHKFPAPPEYITPGRDPNVVCHFHILTEDRDARWRKVEMRFKPSRSVSNLIVGLIVCCCSFPGIFFINTCSFDSILPLSRTYTSDSLQAPALDPIQPNLSTSGYFNLTWNPVVGANQYLVYISYFSSGLFPSLYETLVGSSNCTCTAEITENGTYYIAVVGSNVDTNSTFSNWQGVTINATFWLNIETPAQNDTMFVGLPNLVRWKSSANFDQVYIALVGPSTYDMYAEIFCGNTGENEWIIPTNVFLGAGTYNLTISASNPYPTSAWSNVQVSTEKSVRLVIPTVTIDVGFNSSVAGMPQRISWNVTMSYTLDDSNYTFNDPIERVDIYFARSIPIALNVTNDGYYDWIVPSYLPSGSYFVEIYEAGSDYSFSGEGKFVVHNSIPSSTSNWSYLIPSIIAISLLMAGFVIFLRKGNSAIRLVKHLLSSFSDALKKSFLHYRHFGNILERISKVIHNKRRFMLAFALIFIIVTVLGMLSAGKNVVNPNKIFTKEPAPMGIVDYGVDPFTDAGYSYTTTSFLGLVHIENLSTIGGSYGTEASIQMNVWMIFTNNGRINAIWLQFCIETESMITSEGVENMFFLNVNIWNMTIYSGAINSTGNGWLNHYGQYRIYTYPDGSWEDFPMNHPEKIQLSINCTDEAGYGPKVSFDYNMGQGWQNFDLVAFPGCEHVSDACLVVNGLKYTPIGDFYDAELVLCGSGNGAMTRDVSSNLTLALEYFDGTSYKAIPFWYNFGSDTGETVDNVIVMPATVDGIACAELIQGSGHLV